MAGLSLLDRLFVFYGVRVPNHPRKWMVHERLRSLCGVSVDCEIEATRSGLKWLLNPSDYTDSSLFWFGNKDVWDLYHLKRLVNKGDIILDVGANFGYYSLVLAKALKYQCQIFALEPNPANFLRLCRHIKWNNSEDVIKPFQLGASNRSEIVNMRQPLDNSGHTFVDKDGDISDVMLSGIDDFCKTNSIDSLDVLILDAEGFEERGLMGAGEMIERCKPLMFIEIFPPVMARQNSSPEAIVDFIKSKGYQLFVARRKMLKPLLDIPKGDMRENVFCFHADNMPA